MVTESHLPQVFRLENQNKLLALQLQFTDQTRHTELHFKPTINFSHAVLWLAFMLILDYINPLKPKLNPICYLLALLAHHFLHVSRIRVKSLTLR